MGGRCCSACRDCGRRVVVVFGPLGERALPGTRETQSASAPYQAPAKPKVEKPKGRDGARPSRVERVEPAKAKSVAVTQPKKPLTNWDIRHLSKDETNGLNQAEQNYWKMYHPDPPPDENQPAHNKGKYRIFKSRTDNDISGAGSSSPGVSRGSS